MKKRKIKGFLEAVACGNGVFVVESGKEGEIGEIAERQRAEVRPPENASIEDALGQTDEIEENLGQKWPLKFFYTSVMPVIFVSALIANIQIVGSLVPDRTAVHQS
ncbi:hypothetical protein HRED_07374 [Candidatus Haloredivivus sp. G17]|nr:hypothetical protein HRED_07374 [Candidatus Haloredivivus sp. G17]